MAQFFAWMGDHDRAVDSGERARVIADQLNDFALQVAANFRLGQAYYARGEYRRGIDVLRSNIEVLTGDRATQRFGQTGLPSVLSRAWLIWCAVELGEFDEARLRGEEAMAIAETAAHPFDLVVGSFGLGVLGLRQGRIDTAITVLERALHLCEVGHIPFWFPLIGVWLGTGYALSGRLTDAVPLMKKAVDQHAAIGLQGVHSLFVSLQAEAVLLAGRHEEAAALAHQALDLARNHEERGHEAWALRLLAEIEAGRTPLTAASAEAMYASAIALATELGMRPLVARCQLGLARMHRRDGHADAATAMLSRAQALLVELGMDRWVQADPAI